MLYLQGEKAAPFPSFVVQALHLLQALTSQLEPSPLQADKKRRTTPSYGTSIILTLKVGAPPWPSSLHLEALCACWQVCFPNKAVSMWSDAMYVIAYSFNK